MNDATHHPADAWPVHELAPIGLRVGPLAWRAALLAGPHAAELPSRPSLVVAAPGDALDLLERAAPRVGAMPILVGVEEPQFARRLKPDILARIGALGRRKVQIVTLWVRDVAELKSGSLLQPLFDLRRDGVIDHVGLAAADARDAEWLAIHTSARVLVTPYDVTDQSAAFRAIPEALQSGMAVIARPTTRCLDERAWRFLLGVTRTALPVVDAIPPQGLMPMGSDEIDACWRGFQRDHAPPAPLPRGAPPE